MGDLEHGDASGEIGSVVAAELREQARRVAMGNIEDKIERALEAMAAAQETVAKALEVQAAAQETMAEVAGLLAEQLGGLRSTLRAQGEETKARVVEQVARAQARRDEAIAAAESVRRGVRGGSGAASS